MLSTPVKEIVMRRPKSIEKKTLLNRRNIQHLMSTRQKNTYSANTSIMEQMSSVDKLTLENPWHQKEFKSDSKLPLYDFSTYRDERSKNFIKPFRLVPQKIDASNVNKRLDYNLQEKPRLPGILSKESVLPSTNGSELSLFDDHILSRSFSEDSDDSDYGSEFLLKLERMKYTSDVRNDIGMTTAYFGTDRGNA